MLPCTELLDLGAAGMMGVVTALETSVVVMEMNRRVEVGLITCVWVR